MESDEKEPQIKAPRVTSLQSRASGGRIHVCPARAYVGTKSRSVAFGAGVSTSTVTPVDLRAHVYQRTGIRGRASSRGATLDVCPAGFRH